MPRVRLKIPRYLEQRSESNSTDLVETLVTTSRGESIFELIRRLSAERGLLRQDCFDEKNQMIETNILVILNGRMINPYERSRSILQDDDEITLVSMVYGG
ncbi:MAG: MoaD/ThiS family protein [Thermodesulfobacteriota bacterium]